MKNTGIVMKAESDKPYIPYDFKIRMTNPVGDVHLGTGEVVVDADNIVTHDHQAVYQMGSDETSALQVFPRI